MKTFLVSIISAVAMFSSLAFAKTEVTVGVPGNAPFTGLKGDKPAGIIAEATDAVLRSMGKTPKFSEVPFSRMYNVVHEGSLDVALSVLKTSDRASLAHYSAPIITEYVILITQKGKAFKLNAAADLKGKTIGVRLGFKYPLLDGKPGITLEAGKSNEANLAKLLEGRVDAIAVGSISGLFEIDAAGKGANVEAVERAVGATGLGVAFAKGSFTEDEARKFDELMKKFVASKEWNAILERNAAQKYMKEWKVVD